MEIPYSMEELVPVVAELAEKYTSKESTSVSYETAEKMMDAAIYTIGILYFDGDGDKNSPAGEKLLSPKAAYETGYERIVQKVKEIQKLYNEMILKFNAYGNENYYDTVTKAIPGFFQFYNARFSPQDHLITMDYPTLAPLGDKRGITAIETYLKYICMEQWFLHKIPEDYVISVLTGFQANYKRQFYNICRIILRHLLCSALIGKTLGETAAKRDYEDLCGKIVSCEKEQLENLFVNILKSLIKQQYEGNENLFWYLAQDIKDFVIELFVAAKEGRIERVVRL
ncbi:MAG: DUF6179 domain-containing protein [Clostridiales bacterium]|nr:DUF6179 domain-containing protein [Clostridiales bacterium]